MLRNMTADGAESSDYASDDSGTPCEPEELQANVADMVCATGWNQDVQEQGRQAWRSQWHPRHGMRLWMTEKQGDTEDRVPGACSAALPLTAQARSPSTPPISTSASELFCSRGASASEGSWDSTSPANSEPNTPDKPKACRQLRFPPAEEHDAQIHGLAEPITTFSKRSPTTRALAYTPPPLLPLTIEFSSRKTPVGSAASKASAPASMRSSSATSSSSSADESDGGEYASHTDTCLDFDCLCAQQWDAVFESAAARLVASRNCSHVDMGHRVCEEGGGAGRSCDTSPANSATGAHDSCLTRGSSLTRGNRGLEGNKDEELVWAVDSVPAVHAAIDKLVDVHMSVQVFHTCTCVCIPVV